MTEREKKDLVDWMVDTGTTFHSFVDLDKHVAGHALAQKWAGGFLDACKTLLGYNDSIYTSPIPEVLLAPSQSVTEGVTDNVNHPSHYETGKFECIEVMTEALGVDTVADFCLGNAFKYVYRCMHKHDTPIEDVKKAIWYLNKFIELEG